MKKTSKTILFFGTDDFSAASLRELIEKGFTIGAVITKPDTRKGRGRTLHAPIVKQIAQKHNIPVWQPEKLADIVPKIETLTKKDGQKPVGVLVSYGKLIPERIINLFEPGIINVHPSLLPLYRGPSPIESVILNGEMETGITIMQLSVAMDAGPIYSQLTLPLNDTETAPELEQKCSTLGAQELTRVLPSIISGALQPSKQEDAVATYCHLLKKDDALLTAEQLKTLSAEQAERRIRAYFAFPKTKMTLCGHTVIVTKAHVVSHAKTALDVACGDGRFLSVDELIGPSGRHMSTQSFLNGYGKEKTTLQSV